MGEEKIETGVDDLIRYLRGKGKQSIKDVAKAIHVPDKTLQLWVDFLVEERVVGLEYNFMKPYIFLNEDETEKKKTKVLDLAYFKKQFFETARKKKISDEQIEELWQRHIKSYFTRLKTYFLFEIKKRNFAHQDPEKVFNTYIEKITDDSKKIVVPKPLTTQQVSLTKNKSSTKKGFSSRKESLTKNDSSSSNASTLSNASSPLNISSSSDSSHSHPSSKNSSVGDGSQ